MGLGQVFSKLFGGGTSGGGEAAEAADAVDYNGFTIVAAPLKEGGQYKTAGSISREIAGELKTTSFIRADNYADRESAISHTERKAQQIIDEQGEAMFEREHV
ncbi:HlyU family transcriptional regulator [bacterium]|nr:HlyU family transcriptional regulator [bacterium]